MRTAGMSGLIGALILLCIQAATAEDCLWRRGAIDVGSGSTKAYAAVVDICKKKLVQALFDEKVKIGFGEAREKSASNEIPKEVVTQGAGQIRELLVKMKNLNLKDIRGVATAAFRAAQNGKQAAEELSQLTEVSIQVISQEEEAELGSESALSQLHLNKGDLRPVIVWDIGGGSMQMWSRPQNKTEIYKGELASVTFKNKVIHDLQQKDIQKVSSPNPLGALAPKAVLLAQHHALAEVPEFFKKTATQARWVGIGGVLSLSIQNQVDKRKKQFTSEELDRTLKKKALLKDEQIKSDYKTTEVTNLALVLGYMKALQISKVETLEASLAQGWLLRLP